MTCTNEYQSWNSSTGKPWLKPTPNLVHAHYSPVKHSYDYDFELLFYCPEGMKVHRATGLTVMTSRCKKDGGWTTEWPLCKGKIYNLLFFFISRDWQDISKNIIEEAGRNVASK